MEILREHWVDLTVFAVLFALEGFEWLAMWIWRDLFAQMKSLTSDEERIAFYQDHRSWSYQVVAMPHEVVSVLLMGGLASTVGLIPFYMAPLSHLWVAGLILLSIAFSLWMVRRVVRRGDADLFSEKMGTLVQTFRGLAVAVGADSETVPSGESDPVRMSGWWGKMPVVIVAVANFCFCLTAGDVAVVYLSVGVGAVAFAVAKAIFVAAVIFIAFLGSIIGGLSRRKS